MSQPLRLLLVQESLSGAEPIVEELRRNGHSLAPVLVQTPEDLQDALGRQRWDVIISNLERPGFGSLTALDLVKEMGQDVPFIIVADSIDEATAAAALKAGASDVVTRGRLARLVPAIQRELTELKARRERLLANEALRQSEARYRSLVERSVFGVSRASLDGRFLTANPALARMLGYESVRDVLAINFRDVFLDSGVQDALMNKILTRRSWAGEEVLWRCRSGDAVRVRLSGTLVAGSLPDAAIAEVIVEDVTEQHRLHEQLRQAQKMESIGALASGIAHDFNNLLTTILGYSELLTEQIGADLQTGRDLREIMRAAERASALTRQFLAFSGRQALTLAPLDLNVTIVNLATMMRRLLGDRITLETRLAEHLRPVLADETQVEQVVINLAVNARDAMPEGGRLTIETRSVAADPRAPDQAGCRSGACTVVSVTDTGVGMSREIQDRIFEPFFTTKDRGRGTGLGLAAVHGTINQLGGCVRVQSEPGCGTTFQIYLPETDQVIQGDLASPVEASGAGHEVILVVEDEDSVRAFVRTVLERFGYKVLEADDAESALAELSVPQARVDLLLTDVILPKMDGPELARRIACARPSMRVLFMSGYPERVVTTAGRLEPGLELIEKPFTAQALLSRVRQTLGREPRRAA